MQLRCISQQSENKLLKSECCYRQKRIGLNYCQARAVLGTRHIIFDATLIHTTLDLEVALVSPLVCPRVLDEPIFYTILDAPSLHGDSMATQYPSRCVSVH